MERDTERKREDEVQREQEMEKRVKTREEWK